MANQWAPESIEEDILNKPWRPIPTGKVTESETRRLLLVLIPLVVLLNYVLGVSKQGLFIVVLTWMYNDLRGGDEAVRHPIIAVAYAMFNSASLEITVGEGEHSPVGTSHKGILWTAMVSIVILTTMHVQDLKDQAGDRTRKRQTIVLWLSDRFASASIGISICFWSVTYPIFWDLKPYVLAVPAPIGIYTVYRLAFKTTAKEDASTRGWWSVCTMALYLLPALALL
ncbi:UbiA prenyltransferase family [Xylariaceae sp. FL0255]|nr:UbiA prenyltransferase family [Xylariaceae sp. FL0255]